MSVRHLTVIRLPLVAAMILGAAQPGYADGWRVPMQGVKALGSSYAGRAFISDASVAWFNPAAMRKLNARKWTLTLAPPVISFQLGYRDHGTTNLLGQPIAGSSSADGGATAAVPHLYVVRRVTDRVSAGFGFNAPFGLGTDYGETYAGRYHGTKTSLRVFNLNPSVAVQVRPGLSVAAGLDVQRAQTTIATMIDFGSVGAVSGLGLAPQGHDGKLEFTGSSWAVGYDVSLLWDASDRTRVGLVYRSKVTHGFDGTADFTVPTAAAPLTGGGLVFADGGAATSLTMPHDVAVNLSQALNDRWMLLGDVSWSAWSAFKTLEVTFDNPLQPAITQDHSWRNTVRGAVGGEYRASDRWTWRAGAAYEMAPVPDKTRGPRLPEKNHVWMSAGVTRRFSDTSSIDISYSNLRTKTAPLALTDPLAGTLAADVRWRLNIVAISWNKSF